MLAQRMITVSRLPPTEFVAHTKREGMVETAFLLVLVVVTATEGEAHFTIQLHCIQHPFEVYIILFFCKIITILLLTW